MAIVGARIDNRLLHGIVATTWLPQSNATRVMVIDDATANDQMLKESMKLARPAGIAISVITENTALANFAKKKYDRQRVFVLAKTPNVFLNLINSKIKINKLILGGTLTYDNAIKVTNRAYIKKTEIPVYKEILDKGTQVVSMYTTNDDPTAIEPFLKKGV